MDLRQLRTFVTVADEGTVSKAASRLGIAQPALSRQIRDLEHDLGVKLFDRVRRRLVVTSEGQELLADCRNILGSTNLLKERAQSFRRPDTGLLKVAATPPTIDGILSVFVARYAKRRPNVQVRLTESFGAPLIGLVESGAVHFVISTVGAMSASKHSLDVMWLPSLEFVAAFDPALPLANGDSMDVRTLGQHPLLLMDASFAVRAAFDAACRVAEFKPNIGFESRTPHTLLALAEAGHGIAIVPSVMPTYRYKLRVVRLLYRRKPLREGYAILRDPRRSLPASAADFCDALIAYAQEVLGSGNPAAKRVSGRPKA